MELADGSSPPSPPSPNPHSPAAARGVFQPLPHNAAHPNPPSPAARGVFQPLPPPAAPVHHHHHQQRRCGGPPPLSSGCEDHWSWNKHDKSHEVRLYGPKQRIAHFHPNWSNGTAGVRGTRVLNGGRYYWEINVSQRKDPCSFCPCIPVFVRCSIRCSISYAFAFCCSPCFIFSIMLKKIFFGCVRMFFVAQGTFPAKMCTYLTRQRCSIVLSNLAKHL